MSTKNSIIKNKGNIFYSLGLIAIFVIWLFLSLIIDNELILPSIKSVFNTLFNLLKTSSTYKIILFTLIRIIISLFIGVIIGIILGVLSGIIKYLHDFLSPIIKIMRALPIASIILIILVMFGMKGFNDITFSPIIVSVLLIIPIVYEAVYKGIINIDKELIDVARLETSSKKDLIVYSYLPLIKNEISISISQSIGLSFKSMVMAEYISQTQTSIGRSLLNSKVYFDYSSVFAWTIILIILAIILEFISKIIIEDNRLKLHIKK